MSNYVFKFTADTIDGKIQQHPQQFQLRCDKVKPIGLETVRDYNGSECIQAMKVFLIMYDGQLLGNKCHESMAGFVGYLKSVCYTDYLGIDGCRLTFNGCDLILN